MEFPGIGDAMYVTVTADVSYHARVEDARDGVLAVSAPLSADVPVPAAGAPLHAFWVRNRVRYALTVRMLGVAGWRPWRWLLHLAGEPEPQTRRRFVRGGGGGAVQLWRPHAVDPAVREGRLLDVSEGGLRGRMPAAGFAKGEPLKVRTWLGDELVVADGEVLSVRSPAEPTSLDVVVEYDLDESIARRLRRYLYAWEVEERRRTRHTAW